MQQSNATPPAREASEPLVLVLALATLVQALATFSVFALPTLAPKAASTYGLAPQMVGYQVSVTYIAAAALSGFGGLIVRRFGACATSLAAMATAALGLLAIASGNLFLTILGSLCIGTGYGVTNPAGTHMLLRYERPGWRNMIFAIKQSGVPLGAIIASTMLPRLAERIGWQAAIAASVLMMVAIAGPLLYLRRSLDADRDPTTTLRSGALAGIGLILARPMLGALSVVGFCYAASQVSLLAFAVTMLVTEFGWSLVEAGTIAAVMQGAGIAGRLLWSMVADRRNNGSTVLIVVGVLSIALALATGAMTPAWPPLATVAVLAAFGACIIGWNGVYMAETARAAGPRDAGLATGGVLIFNFVGVIIGPALFGIVARAIGSLSTTFALFAVLPLLGALALAKVMRDGSRGNEA